jgi:hypothetical protein
MGAIQSAIRRPTLQMSLAAIASRLDLIVMKNCQYKEVDASKRSVDLSAAYSIPKRIGKPGDSGNRASGPRYGLFHNAGIERPMKPQKEDGNV